MLLRSDPTFSTHFLVAMTTAALNTLGINYNNRNTTPLTTSPLHSVGKRKSGMAKVCGHARWRAGFRPGNGAAEFLNCHDASPTASR